MFHALGFRYTAIQPTLYMICSYLLQNLILCIESCIPSDHGGIATRKRFYAECFLRAIIHPISSLQIKSSSQWLYPAKIISVLRQNETIFSPNCTGVILPTPQNSDLCSSSFCLVLNCFHFLLFFWAHCSFQYLMRLSFPNQVSPPRVQI